MVEASIERAFVHLSGPAVGQTRLALHERTAVNNTTFLCLVHTKRNAFASVEHVHMYSMVTCSQTCGRDATAELARLHVQPYEAETVLISRVLMLVPSLLEHLNTP